mmetsp:Transcript_33353/g.72746  ORF Transcript_33353/g.72746 Transcript_33353/m.72746 type:complete len:235 (+) Transcript_33353:443-1147(+)|eukprot:CAMPEP_0118934306 /NCGR_PEP_ID=MMETSP1169-20130426/13749_1 /TAXON_ID=36882 /ORGANISM="Pyramimonas obovata, Strain CCMP722" /LENGTH=234 /DNA_ID=CAMNT_0006877195 /DNA_START=408 /DNA_END=1112 /DNA_ORIENTATION=-
MCAQGFCAFLPSEGNPARPRSQRNLTPVSTASETNGPLEQTSRKRRAGLRPSQASRAPPPAVPRLFPLWDEGLSPCARRPDLFRRGIAHRATPSAAEIEPDQRSGELLLGAREAARLLQRVKGPLQRWLLRVQTPPEQARGGAKETRAKSSWAVAADLLCTTITSREPQLHFPLMCCVVFDEGPNIRILLRDLAIDTSLGYVYRSPLIEAARRSLKEGDIVTTPTFPEASFGVE